MIAHKITERRGPSATKHLCNGTNKQQDDRPPEQKGNKRIGKQTGNALANLLQTIQQFWRTRSTCPASDDCAHPLQSSWHKCQTRVRLPNEPLPPSHRLPAVVGRVVADNDSPDESTAARVRDCWHRQTRSHHLQKLFVHQPDFFERKVHAIPTGANVTSRLPSTTNVNRRRYGTNLRCLSQAVNRSGQVFNTGSSEFIRCHADHAQRCAIRRDLMLSECGKEHDAVFRRHAGISSSVHQESRRRFFSDTGLV